MSVTTFLNKRAELLTENITMWEYLKRLLLEPGFLGENLKKYFKPKRAIFWRKKPKVAFPQKVT